MIDLHKEREKFEFTLHPSIWDMISYSESNDSYVPNLEREVSRTDAKETNIKWEMWKKNAEITTLKQQISKFKSGEFVLVEKSKVKYFSFDGENFEIHETMEKAKYAVESTMDYFRDRLADQMLDPDSDGNFHDVSYGVVLAQSSHSVDHIVTQEDVDNSKYNYEVGTQIMSLFMIEAGQGESNEIEL